MRILFSTWPAHGHLLPMLPLIRAAQRAGDEIVVASGAEGVAEASRRGLTPSAVAAEAQRLPALRGSVRAVQAEIFGMPDADVVLSSLK